MNQRFGPSEHDLVSGALSNHHRHVGWKGQRRLILTGPSPRLVRQWVGDEVVLTKFCSGQPLKPGYRDALIREALTVRESAGSDDTFEGQVRIDDRP